MAKLLLLATTAGIRSLRNTTSVACGYLVCKTVTVARPVAVGHRH